MSDFEGNRALLNSETVPFIYVTYQCTLTSKKLELYMKDAVVNSDVLYSDTSANIQIFIRKFHA